MAQYQIGTIHPLQSRLKSMQNYVMEFNTDFFDGLYYIKTPTKSQVSSWKGSQFRYGLYTEANVPFFLMDFPNEKWNFMIPVNIYEVPEKERQQCLASKGNIVNIFLLNADSKVIESLRTFKTDTKFATQLRSICEAQLKQYKNADEVNQAIKKVATQRNALQMMGATKMLTLMTI